MVCVQTAASPSNFKTPTKDITNPTESSMSDRPKPIWAKMTGFTTWPARYCSKFETDDLRKRIVPKSNQVAAVFMERKIKRAWLNENAVEEFKLTSLFSTNGTEQFNAKVFESNANYRLAIMEAVRICYDPDDPCSSPEEAAKNASLYAMALKLIRKHEPDYPEKYREERSKRAVAVEVCEICAGTFCSGELRACCVTEDVKADPTSKHCNGRGRVHFHCLQPMDKINVMERWFCSVCCDNYGWQRNMLLPEDGSLAPFFGTIDRYLPPSNPTEGDQMYHVSYDDGDGEEYFEHELQHAMDLYDRFKGTGDNAERRVAMLTARLGPRTWHGTPVKGKKKDDRPWSTAHAAIGVKVCKYFAGVMADPIGPSPQQRKRNQLEFEVKTETGGRGRGSSVNKRGTTSRSTDTDMSESESGSESDNASEDNEIERVTMKIAPPARPAPPSRAGTRSKVKHTSRRGSGSPVGRASTSSRLSESISPAINTTRSSSATTTRNSVTLAPPSTTRSAATTSFLSGVESAATTIAVTNGGRSHPLSSANTTTTTMFSTTNRAAARRAIVLLDQPPEVQKARLNTYIESQAAVKRKLEGAGNIFSNVNNSSNSSNGTSGISGSSAIGGPGVDVVLPDNPYVPPYVIKKKARIEVEEPDTPDKAKNPLNSSILNGTGNDTTSTTSAATTTSTASSTSNTTSTTNTASEALPPSSSCVLPANVIIVDFIDECLRIMLRHRDTMLLSRRESLRTRHPVPASFCHKLVESMASDIIQIVADKLPLLDQTLSEQQGQQQDQQGDQQGDQGGEQVGDVGQENVQEQVEQVQQVQVHEQPQQVMQQEMVVEAPVPVEGF